MNGWQVLGLVLIIEAVLPFISPAQYRAMAARLSALSDQALRGVALVLLVVGAGLVAFVRW
ncbi:DUF2065 domain-containing protein [Halothiobacillus sp. DCM-1]|uniref:DUF2065 domain-containing protein n=1 Tax=Halothiobacillus sp. DCM-1 TaxID=3112558 RepID=UPI0032444104